MSRLSTGLLLVAAIALCALVCSASAIDARKDNQHASKSYGRLLNEDRSRAPRTHTSHTRNGIKLTDSPYVSSSRSSAGVYFEVEWPSYWSNATFAEAVCNISLETDVVTSIEIEPNDYDVPILWVLPECIYPYLNSLVLFRARNVIIRGSASIAGGDPLLRLSPTIDSFVIRHPTVLQNPSKSYSGGKYPYAMDWTKLFNRFPLLDSIEISGAQLTGTLPSSLPSLVSNFEVSKNSLSGGIPATLLSNISPGAAGVILDLGENALTGALPAGLFSFLNASSPITSVTFYLDNNRLTGDIPAGLLASAAPLLDYFSFNVGNNQLTGTLPANLLANSSSVLHTLYIRLYGNRFTGTIPASLFAPLVGISTLRYLTFSAAANQLSGSIPDLWTNSVLSSLGEVALDLSDNRLNGTIPSYLAPASPVSIFSYNLASNQLTGTISSSIMSARTIFDRYALNLDNNQLSGDLPSTLSVNYVYTASLSVASNSLSGTLPSASFLTEAERLATLTLNLANNDFEGSLSVEFLSVLTSRSGSHLTLNLANCGLSGTIPATFRGSVSSLAIDISNNAFNGTIPSSIFTDVSTHNVVVLNAAHNKLTGPLSIPAPTASYSSIIANISYNDLTELVIATEKRIHSLDVSHNNNLTGTFPASLFDSASYLEVLNASHTALSGTFPDLSGQVLAVDLIGLDLSFTNIDFCSGNRTLWTSPTLLECNLRNTTVSTSCSNAYPAMCTSTEGRITTPDSPTASAPSQLTGLVASLFTVIVIALLLV